MMLDLSPEIENVGCEIRSQINNLCWLASRIVIKFRWDQRPTIYFLSPNDIHSPDPMNILNVCWTRVGLMDRFMLTSAWTWTVRLGLQTDLRSSFHLSIDVLFRKRIHCRQLFWSHPYYISAFAWFLYSVKLQLYLSLLLLIGHGQDHVIRFLNFLGSFLGRKKSPTSNFEYKLTVFESKLGHQFCTAKSPQNCNCGYQYFVHTIFQRSKIKYRGKWSINCSCCCQ